MKLSGSCLRGRVTFRLEGWVSKIQACHARRCRKATGAAFAPEIAASCENFEWLSGADMISIYEAPLIDTPPAYRRAFCRNCGSPLPVEIAGSGMVVLHAGIVDDDRALNLFRHAFVDQKAAWVEIADGKAQFAGQPPVPDRDDILG